MSENPEPIPILQLYETILVQGANGNTGSATLDSLIQQAGPNTRLRAGVRRLGTEQTKEWEAKGVEVVELDSAKPDTVAAAFKGITGALIIPPNEENRADIAGVFVEAAKAAGVKHLVLLSVFNAQTESFTFALQMRAAEKQVEACGLDWTILRPIWFLENLYGSAAGIKAGELSLGIGEGKFAPVSITDIGRAAAAALLRPGGHAGQYYDLTGPVLVSGAELAQAFEKVTGKPVSFVSPPEETTRAHLTELGLPAWRVTAALDLLQHFADHKAESVATGVQWLSFAAPIAPEAWIELHREKFLE